MSVSINRVQLCSYCKEPGHRSDKCSCPSLLELLVDIIKFVNSLTTQESVDNTLLTFLNTKDPVQIKILSRNLNLIPNMVISLDVTKNNLSTYILQDRRIENMRIEDDFINRVNGRIGDRSELMVEYRGLPIILQISSLSRIKRNAKIAYQHTIGRLTNTQITQEFINDLHIAQTDRSTHERFMETYSGLRFTIDNIIISKYYVRMWTRYMRNVQSQLTESTDQIPQLELVPIQEPIRDPPPPPPYHQVENFKVNIIQVKTFVMPFECPICYERVEGKCVLTLCEHKYCNKCFDGISNMFRRDDGHNHCPMCRSVLSQAISCEVLNLNDLSLNELN